MQGYAVDDFYGVVQEVVEGYYLEASSREQPESPSIFFTGPLFRAFQQAGICTQGMVFHWVLYDDGSSILSKEHKALASVPKRADRNERLEK